MKYTRNLQKQWKRNLFFYVVFLLIWSFSVLLMPIASVQKELTVFPMFISGGCFWIGLIGTILMGVKINRFSKKIYKNKSYEIKKLGLICFFSNKKATITDIVMFVSVVCFIVIKICIDNIYLLFTSVSLFVFSFGMHCMLNGKNYIYLNNKVRRENES